ncbi:stAR-related lipid transfer protein 4 isoform X2 [Heptranchias perlo]|uniref:stAR-related lipid transfer protein 4 isoform X2 n=1 Tax=Heptranchias perlo TaxID=212740 RepID=UPI00355A156D
MGDSGRSHQTDQYLPAVKCLNIDTREPNHRLVKQTVTRTVALCLLKATEYQVKLLPNSQFECCSLIEMETLPDVQKLAAEVESTLIKYYSIGEDEWRVGKKTEDVIVWRKPSEEFGGFLYKTQGIVKEAPNRVVDYIRPGPYRLDWDSLMTSLDIVGEFEQDCCLMHYTTAGQLWNVIAPREFIDFSYTTDHQDGLLSCGVSVEYGEKQPNFIRGFNHPCGWFCIPLKSNPDHSLLTGFIQTDLRGMLPQTMVDSAMANSLVNFYNELRNALKA